jgi:hypothetical protein
MLYADDTWVQYYHADSLQIPREVLVDCPLHRLSIQLGFVFDWAASDWATNAEVSAVDDRSECHLPRQTNLIQPGCSRVALAASWELRPSRGRAKILLERHVHPTARNRKMYTTGRAQKVYASEIQGGGSYQNWCCCQKLITRSISSLKRIIFFWIEI